jgi:hypothetical protein
MHLDIRTPCPSLLKIWLPHLETPISAKKVAHQFPEFAALFDGKATENTLLFYYKLNIAEQCLDFIDEDAEEEVAELLGVTITEIEMINEDTQAGDFPEARDLTQKEIDEFKEHINDIRQGLDTIK